MPGVHSSYHTRESEAEQTIKAHVEEIEAR